MAIIKPSINTPKGAQNQKTAATPYTAISAKKTASGVTPAANKAKPVIDIKQYKGIKGTAAVEQNKNVGKQVGMAAKPSQVLSQQQTEKTKLSVYKAKGGFWSKILSCFGKK